MDGRRREGARGGWSMPHASRWDRRAERHLDNLCLAFRGGEGGLAGGVVAQVGFTEEP